jgi:hypothetical protein
MRPITSTRTYRRSPQTHALPAKKRAYLLSAAADTQRRQDHGIGSDPAEAARVAATVAGGRGPWSASRTSAASREVVSGPVAN